MVTLLVGALAVPALTGAALILSGRGSKPPTERSANLLSLAASVVTAALVVGAVITRPRVDHPWVPSLGIRLQFWVDGISAPLLLMTAALGIAVVLHARSHPSHGGSPTTFYGCLQLVVLGALATFLARDAILFYLSFEIVLVPMWVLISRYGDTKDLAARDDAAGRFVLYTVLGSTLMLIGILALVHTSGTANLDVLAKLHGAGIDRNAQIVISALLLVGMGIKVPVWPLHTWLPCAHRIAPTAGSVMLAAVLLKMGTYGIVRLVIAPLPIGFGVLAPAFALLGVVGIIWGGMACLVENDLKRLIAYSSVAHMGFVVLGLSSGTTVGLQAALFANIAHGVVSALLFFLVGGLKERWGSADLATAHAALREVSPRLGIALVVGLAASLGLPGLVGFWGEFLAMYSAWSPAPDRPEGFMRVLVVVSVTGTAVAAGYSLRVLRLIWSGDRTTPAHQDARGGELSVLAVLATAVLVLGIAPGLVLNSTIKDVTAITAITAEVSR